MPNKVSVVENGEMFDVRINGALSARWSKDWIADLDGKYIEHTIQCMLGHLYRKDSEHTLAIMQDWFRSSHSTNYRVEFEARAIGDADEHVSD